MKRVLTHAIVAILASLITLVVICPRLEKREPLQVLKPEPQPLPGDPKGEGDPNFLTRQVTQVTFERNGGAPIVVMKEPSANMQHSFTSLAWGEASYRMASGCAYEVSGTQRLEAEFKGVTVVGALADSGTMTLEALRLEMFEGICKWAVHYADAAGNPVTVIFPKAIDAHEDARNLAHLISETTGAGGHASMTLVTTTPTPKLVFTWALPAGTPPPNECADVAQPPGSGGPN